MPGGVFRSPESHERAASHQWQRALGSIGNQRITIDQGDKRACAAKHVMSFGNVTRGNYMMACPDQRLRKSFEQRLVGSNDKNECQIVSLHHPQNCALNKSDYEIRDDRRDVDRAHPGNDLAKRLEDRLTDCVRPPNPR